MRLSSLFLAAALLTPVFALASLKPDSSVNEVLTALDEVGKDLKSFSANVTLREKDKISQDSWKRTGTAVYQLKPDGNARFRVTFLKRVQDELSQDQRQDYLLEDNWLTDRNYPKKLETRMQMAKPGERINLFKLGEGGHFPLPIGQAPQDVLRMFGVEKGAAAKDDPAGTVHLRLTPKPNTEFARKLKIIDVWVDLTSNMPRRIDTVDANETMMQGTDLDDLKLNTPLADEQFKLSPLPGDWERRDEAFKD